MLLRQVAWSKGPGLAELSMWLNTITMAEQNLARWIISSGRMLELHDFKLPDFPLLCYQSCFGFLPKHQKYFQWPYILWRHRMARMDSQSPLNLPSKANQKNFTVQCCAKISLMHSILLSWSQSDGKQLCSLIFSELSLQRYFGSSSPFPSDSGYHSHHIFFKASLCITSFVDCIIWGFFKNSVQILGRIGKRKNFWQSLFTPKLRNRVHVMKLQKTCQARWETFRKRFDLIFRSRKSDDQESGIKLIFLYGTLMNMMS